MDSRFLVLLLAAVLLVSCTAVVCADIIVIFQTNTIVSPHGGASGNIIHLRTSTFADVRGSIDADLGWTGMNIDFGRGKVHKGKIPSELYLKRFVKHTLYVRCRPVHGTWEEQRRNEVLVTWDFNYGSADTIAPSVREGSPGADVLFDGTAGSKYVSFLVIESGTGIKMVRGCTENTRFPDMIHKFNFRRNTPMGAIYVGNVTVNTDTRTLYIACQDKAGNISPAFEWSKIASKSTAKVVDTKADVSSDFQVLEVENPGAATCTVTAHVPQLDGPFSSAGEYTYRFTLPEELLDDGYRLVRRQVVSVTEGADIRWEELNPMGYSCVVHLPLNVPDTARPLCMVHFILTKERTVSEPLPPPILLEPVSRHVELAGSGTLVFTWDGEGSAYRFVIVDTQSGRCLFKRQVSGTSLTVDSDVFGHRRTGTCSWSVSQADDHLVFSPFSMDSFEVSISDDQSGE